ncbi:MAG: ferredoxin family protein [Planctomycetota bacterium]|jgi:ferredoxin like protein
MKTDEKLTKNFFREDKESHIHIKVETCHTCPFPACVQACPAGLYEFDKEKMEAKVEFAGCLECGTCRYICLLQAIEWNPPKGGFGVQYRYG